MTKTDKAKHARVRESRLVLEGNTPAQASGAMGQRLGTELWTAEWVRARPPSCGVPVVWRWRHALDYRCPAALAELKRTARNKLRDGQCTQSIITACWNQVELW